MLVYKNIFIILEVFVCAINCFFLILHFYNFSLRFILTFAFYNSAVRCKWLCFGLHSTGERNLITSSSCITHFSIFGVEFFILCEIIFLCSSFVLLLDLALLACISDLTPEVIVIHSFDKTSVLFIRWLKAILWWFPPDRP